MITDDLDTIVALLEDHRANLLVLEAKHAKREGDLRDANKILELRGEELRRLRDEAEVLKKQLDEATELLKRANDCNYQGFKR